MKNFYIHKWKITKVILLLVRLNLFEKSIHFLRTYLVNFYEEEM